MATSVETIGNTTIEDRVDRLLSTARDGNELAFEELMRLFRTDVYRLALGMLGQPDQASDVSQDVFLRFYNALGRLKAAKGLKAWLRRVTVNRCYDMLKARNRREKIEVQLTPGCMAGDENFDTAEIIRLVQQSLSFLAPRERAALVLTCQLGFSSEEAGTAMGCRPSTVRVLTLKARNKIKSLLMPADDDWRT